MVVIHIGAFEATTDIEAPSAASPSRRLELDVATRETSLSPFLPILELSLHSHVTRKMLPRANLLRLAAAATAGRLRKGSERAVSPLPLPLPPSGAPPTAAAVVDRHGCAPDVSPRHQLSATAVARSWRISPCDWPGLAASRMGLDTISRLP